MRFIRPGIIILTIILATVMLVSAQDDDTIDVNTEVVNVSVSVVDRNGNMVDNLTKDDFELFDNKANTEIAFFSSRTAPISYGIVYDLHPTTSEQSDSILRSLKAFTNGLGENEDFFLTVFNEYGSLNVNFVPTSEQIRRHLSFGERNEPNSLYDAVYFAGEKLRGRPNQKKNLIIISDGQDRQSHHKFSELERLFDSFSVQIYAVILNEKDVWDYDELATDRDVIRSSIDESELDKAAIKALSAESGGTASTSRSRGAIDLYKIFERISEEARGSYSLGFYPSEGGSHKIDVRVKDGNNKGYKLGHRKEYKLPEKAKP